MKRIRMKKIIIGMLSVFSLVVSAAKAQVVTGFDDILMWTGTGANKAALVVDFHDTETKKSFVWGYRWNGSATGYDMLTAIDVASVELTVTSPSYATLISYTEQGVTHSQYAYANSSWGYWIAGGSATVYPWDSSPPYDISIAGGGTTLPTAWTSSPSGTSTRFLADGSWDSFSFGTYNTDTYAPEVSPFSTAYAAIPEPTPLALCLLSLGLFFYARKRFLAC